MSARANSTHLLRSIASEECVIVYSRLLCHFESIDIELSLEGSIQRLLSRIFWKNGVVELVWLLDVE